MNVIPPAGVNRPLAAPPHCIAHKRQHGEDQEDDKEDLGHTHKRSCDSAKPKYPGNQRDDKTSKGKLQHDEPSENV